MERKILENDINDKNVNDIIDKNFSNNLFLERKILKNNIIDKNGNDIIDKNVNDILFLKDKKNNINKTINENFFGEKDS